MEKKELTEQQKAFLDYLFSEETFGDIRQAMKLAGYPERTPTSRVVKALRDEIISLAKDYLASNSAAASMKLVQSLFTDKVSGNQLKAAQTILDRVGMGTPKEGVELSVPAGGLVILPAKGYVPHTEEEDNEEGK